MEPLLNLSHHRKRLEAQTVEALLLYRTHLAEVELAERARDDAVEILSERLSLALRLRGHRPSSAFDRIMIELCAALDRLSRASTVQEIARNRLGDARAALAALESRLGYLPVPTLH